MSQNLSDDAEIKGLFVDESLEALQRVEDLLLAAERGGAPADLVDTMFRDMHTIKGTSALLGFERTASLAHAAEDLMARLRERSMVARPAHFALMVQVVDVLREFVETIRDAGEEGLRDSTAIVAGLRHYVELGDDAPDAEAAAAPVASEPEPVKLTPVAEPTPPATQAAPATVAAAQASPPPTPTPTPPAQEAASPPPAAPAPAGQAAPPVASAPSAVAAAKATAKATDERAPARPSEADSTVRVNVALLDTLMNLMGELVLSRNQMVQLVRSNRDPAAQAAAQRLSLVTSDLQEQIMKTRMQPVARVFEKIPRQVRDLSQQVGKRVEIEIDGTTTELDKALVEAIRDPVMHIVRNAIDHGLETPAEREAAGKSPEGRLTVRAAHQGSTVSIEVVDDGRGIDPAKVKAVALKRGVISAAEAERLSEREAIDLIFRPGFSTAEAVTSISGRGVGMDVVRTHVERAGGHVELESQLGQGTTIRLKMPLTLAIIPALLVQEGAQRFAIPQPNLLELVHLDEQQAKTQIENVRGVPVYRLRGELLPILRLGTMLRGKPPAPGPMNVVVVSAGQRRYGLAVESISDTEEIVIKPLHGSLKKLNAYAGATVLGDGSVALILDVAGLASMAGIDLFNRAENETVAATTDEQAAQSMLLFRIGRDTQCAVPVSMVNRLEQLDRASIERVGGREVLQYRGDIMPIVRPEQLVPVDPAEEHGALQQLLVFQFGRPVAVAVSAILDATEVGTVHPPDLPYTLGKTVVAGRTTLLLDVFEVVRALSPSSLEAPAAARHRPRVLLADESDAMRGSLAGFLRAAGLEVSEANGATALRELRVSRRHFDAVVTSVEPLANGLDLVRRISSELPALPVFCIGTDEAREPATAAGARDCVSRLDRQALLSALQHTLQQTQEAA